MGVYLELIFYELVFWSVIGAITLRFLTRYISSEEDFTEDELEDTTTWD